MKDQVTASLTGGGWLEVAEERPPQQQTDQTVRAGERHVKESEKYMFHIQRNTCRRIREIHVTELEKYIRHIGDGWLEESEERPAHQQQTYQTVRGKGRKPEIELSRMWMVCLAFSMQCKSAECFLKECDKI